MRRKRKALEACRSVWRRTGQPARSRRVTVPARSHPSARPRPLRHGRLAPGRHMKRPRARGARAAPLAMRLLCLACLTATARAFEPASADWQLQMGAAVGPAQAATLREEVREMARGPRRCSPRARLRRCARAVFVYLRQLHAARLSSRRAAAAELRRPRAWPPRRDGTA